MTDVRKTMEPPAVSPEWFEKAFEEPEVYWACGCYNVHPSRPVCWARLFFSLEDAQIARSEDGVMPGEYGHSVITMALDEALSYARSRGFRGVRIMARDEHGWMILKEIPV